MPANIFLLFGNDEYGIAQRVRQFIAEFKDPGAADMNTARLEAATMSDEALNTAAQAAPFLADHRLVIVANPSRKYTEAAARRKFEDFILKAPPTARLVLCEELEPKEAEKHWLVKWADKNREAVRAHAFMLPRAREMTAWITQEAAGKGGAIERQAAEKLAEMVGNDTRRAAQEIDKLLAFANWSRPVRLEDVQALSIFSAEQSVFDFVDALAQGSGTRAQSLLHRLLETDEPFALWGMVVRQFRLMIQAREILDGRGNDKDVARTLGVHPYVAEKATKQARRFSMQQLEDLYRKLLSIDEGVKTGQTTLDLALDLLVVELAG